MRLNELEMIALVDAAFHPVGEDGVDAVDAQVEVLYHEREDSKCLVRANSPLASHAMEISKFCMVLSMPSELW